MHVHVGDFIHDFSYQLPPPPFTTKVFNGYFTLRNVYKFLLVKLGNGFTFHA